MTDDTTTDREEAGCPFWQEQHGCAIAIDQRAEVVTYTYGGSHDPATILADIEEGKRKDATIERLEAKVAWHEDHLVITTAGQMAQVKRLTNTLTALVEVANFEVDTDECWYDHHGYCQAHGCGDMGDRETPHCPTAALKEQIALAQAALKEATDEREEPTT